MAAVSRTCPFRQRRGHSHQYARRNASRIEPSAGVRRSLENWFIFTRPLRKASYSTLQKQGKARPAACVSRRIPASFAREACRIQSIATVSTVAVAYQALTPPPHFTQISPLLKPTLIIKTTPTCKQNAACERNAPLANTRQSLLPMQATSSLFVSSVLPIPSSSLSHPQACSAVPSPPVPYE